MVAVKISKKSSKRSRSYFTSEVDALQSIDHKNVVKLMDSGEDDMFYYIVMEYLPYPHLQSYLDEHGNMDECIARGIFTQLCKAVVYIHSNHFVHHDIKLENVLVDRNNNIKVVDFGLSIYLPQPNMKVSKFSGSIGYTAPEIMTHEPYDPKQAEIWTLGVVLYRMMFNKNPYALNTDFRDKLVVSKFDLGLRRSDQISPELADLLEILMTIDPCKRIKLEEIIAHPWMQHANESCTSL